MNTIAFSSSQDQARLLKSNINQLYTASGLACLFAFIVFFISSKSKRLPFLLGLVIPSSIIISIGVLGMIGLTINIITLSGFILGIGLLVDNVIILIEEITQKRNTGLSIKEACIVSSKNIFPALLSSSLTTICVFIPLVSVNGIASELFLEQAIALVIVLLISLIVTFTLIPVYYLVWIKSEITDYRWLVSVKNFVHKKSRFYLQGVIVALLIGGAIFLTPSISREDLPSYGTTDGQIRILWNEPISLEENAERTQSLLEEVELDFASANLGLNRIYQNEINFFDQANIYFETHSVEAKKEAVQKISSKLDQTFQNATYTINKAINPIEMIFYDEAPPIEIRFRKNQGGLFNKDDIQKLKREESAGSFDINFNNSLVFDLENEKIVASSLEVPTVIEHLRNLSDERIITSLKQPEQSIPITINFRGEDYFIRKDSSFLPITQFYTLRDTLGLRNITSDLSGPYLSFISNNQNDAVRYAKNTSQETGWLFDVSGAALTRDKNLERLIWSGILGIVLLYLILVAQFESFKQPLAIFLMVPLSLAGGVLMIFLSGNTLNIMTLIGLIVMLGIIVNDSILKIDAINRNLKDGPPTFRGCKQSQGRAIQTHSDDKFIYNSGTCARIIISRYWFRPAKTVGRCCHWRIDCRNLGFDFYFCHGCMCLLRK